MWSEDSALRQFCIAMIINPHFANVIMLSIFINCAFMTSENPPLWVDEYLEYLFLSVYTFEAIVKIIARGFWSNKLAYIRDPWNWLDFFVIVTAYITESLKVFNLLGTTKSGAQPAILKVFRVFRVLKTMSIVPGLRSIVQALLHSIRALKDAIVLTMFFLTVYSLIGYQLFNGTFRNKCVQYPPYNTRYTQLSGKILYKFNSDFTIDIVDNNKFKNDQLNSLLSTTSSASYSIKNSEYDTDKFCYTRDTIADKSLLLGTYTIHDITFLLEREKNINTEFCQFSVLALYFESSNS